MHKFPVGSVRLSKLQARYLVSCGDETDVTLKLWNIASACTEALSTTSTSQLRHKRMSQNSNYDVFSVAAGTSEVKLYQIGGKQAKTQESLHKITTLTKHSKEVLHVAFDGEHVASISKDQTFVLYKIEMQFGSSVAIV